MQEALENITVAVKSGRADIVKSLIDACQTQGVSYQFTLEDLLNTVCTPYGTLLHWTTKIDDADIVRTLLCSGANPSLRNKENETVLEFISSDMMASVFVEEFLRATAQSDIEKVQKMLSAGIDVNCYDSAESHNTPLHWAASYSDVDTITCLLDHGAGVTIVNSSGTTPLHDAVDRGDLEIIRLLLEKGASPILRATNGKFAGKSCLDLAVEKPAILTTLVQFSSIIPDYKNGIDDLNVLKRSPSLESLLSTSQDISLTPDKLHSKSTEVVSDRIHKRVDQNLSLESVKVDDRVRLLWPMPQWLKFKNESVFIPTNILKLQLYGTKLTSLIFRLMDRQKIMFMNELQCDLRIDVFPSVINVRTLFSDATLICYVNKSQFKSCEEFKLDLSSNKVKLTASDESGLYYGMQTLRQLMKLYKHETGIPDMMIHDWPNVSTRSVLFDVSSHFRVPTLDYLKIVIDKLSNVRINQFHLHTRFTDSNSEWQHPYNPCDLIKLDQICSSCHIDLIPVIEVDHKVTLNNIDAITCFVTKYVSCFSSSSVHFGPRLTSILISVDADDVTVNLWKYFSFVATYSTIYLCMNSFHGDVDVALRLPLNVILLDYGFHADYDFSSSCRSMSTNSLCVLPCAGTAAWNSLSGCPAAAIMNVYNAICSVATNNLSGILIADWTGSGHITSSLFSWPGFLLMAGFSWNISTPWELFHEIKGDIIDHYGMSNDESSTTSGGKIILELGRVETFVLKASRNQDDNDVSNLPSAAGSTLHQLLIDPDSVNLEHLTPEIFHKAIRYIKKIMVNVPKSSEGCEIRQLHLTADLMVLACRIGKSLSSSGLNPSNKTGLSVVNVGVYNLPSTTKTDLANRLLELTERYRSIWLSYNMAPGLQSALLLLTSLLHKFIPDSIPDESNYGH